jgi:hypothetical protein
MEFSASICFTNGRFAELFWSVLRFLGVACEEFLELLGVGGLGVRRALICAVEANGKSPVEDVGLGSAVGTRWHNLWTTYSYVLFQLGTITESLTVAAR